MINFKISTPGKINLFGVYAMKYGEDILAASLDLRTTLEFAEILPHRSPNRVIIDFTLIDLYVDIPLYLFLNHFYNGNYIFNEDTDLLYEEVKRFINLNNLGRTSHQMEFLQKFFYLLFYIDYKEHIAINSFHVSLSTELLSYKNMGYSASCTICLAACYRYWSLLQKDIDEGFNYDFIKKIGHDALSCEKIIYGASTVIDISVCTYGSILKTRYGGDLVWLSNVLDVPILLVASEVTPDLLVQRERLDKLKELHPEIFTSVLNSTKAISEAAYEVLHNTAKIYVDNTEDVHHNDLMVNEEKFRTLIHMNQELYNVLGLSYPELDDICTTARKYRASGKYVDIGKYAYICYPNNSEVLLMLLEEELTAKGFNIKETKIACTGVRLE